MKLATWNVNSIKVRLPRVLELLEAHAPTVLCLQETKSSPDAFPHAELAEVGYRAADHSGGRWEGVAILAPADTEVSQARRGLPGEPDEGQARYVEAVVEGLRVASVYVPNGRAIDAPQFADKLAFLDALAAHARSLDALFGDLNVTRSDLDVYEPLAFANATHVQPAERERVEALLATGLSDAYRELHPDEPGFTWWDYRQGHFHRGMGLRIDYSLLRGELAERVTACGIDRDFRKGSKPSDHAPLITELSDLDAL